MKQYLPCSREVSLSHVKVRHPLTVSSQETKTVDFRGPYRLGTENPSPFSSQISQMTSQYIIVSMHNHSLALAASTRRALFCWSYVFWRLSCTSMTFTMLCLQTSTSYFNIFFNIWLNIIYEQRASARARRRLIQGLWSLHQVIVTAECMVLWRATAPSNDHRDVNNGLGETATAVSTHGNYDILASHLSNLGA